MKNKDELRDELNELSPFLAKHEHKDLGFRVPKDYFKSLPDEVMKLIREEAAPAKRSWLDDLTVLLQGLFQPRYALVLASVAVLVVAAVYVFKQQQPLGIVRPIAHIELKDISDEALFTYVSNNINDFDKDLIIETQGFEQQEKPLQKITPKPDLQELEQYIDDNLDDIDLNDLQETL